MGRLRCSGVILSRKFGHGVKTDGFFAAYGVYLALVLVAGSLRVDRPAALRRGARGGAARPRGRRVGGRARRCRSRSPSCVAIVWPHGIASALTSNPQARDSAAELLPWVVPSAVAQIYGGLVASALAALDDYEWAAFGFAGGSVAGVVLTLALRRPRRDLARLGARAERRALARDPARAAARPPRAASAGPTAALGRLLELGEGVALPLALQGLYLVALPVRVGARRGRARRRSPTRT